MPNVRAKSKVFFGGFLEREFFNLLTKLAKAERMDRFGFAMKFAREGLRKRGFNIAEPKWSRGQRIQDEFTGLRISTYKRFRLRQKARLKRMAKERGHRRAR